MTKKWVPVGQGPEGRTYFTEVRVPKLKEGKVPPEPESPPPERVPAQRRSAPLADVDPDSLEWPDH